MVAIHATVPGLTTSAKFRRGGAHRGVAMGGAEQTLLFAGLFPIASRQSEQTKRIRNGSLSSTFDRVADIIAETSEIDRAEITPESHTIEDLGIDSLDFLDIVFAIDKEFGIKIPLEKWTQEVNEGQAPTEEYFVLKNLCAKIDELRAAKAAG